MQDSTSCSIFCTIITLKNPSSPASPTASEERRWDFVISISMREVGLVWDGTQISSPFFSAGACDSLQCEERSGCRSKEVKKKTTHPVPHHNDFSQMINIIIKPLLVANMMLMLLSSVKSENSSLLSITGGTAGVSPLTVRMQTYCMSSRR